MGRRAKGEIVVNHFVVNSLVTLRAALSLWLNFASESAGLLQ